MPAKMSPSTDREGGNEEQHEAEKFQPRIGRHKQRVNDGGDHTGLLEDFQIYRRSELPPACPGWAGASMP